MPLNAQLSILASLRLCCYWADFSWPSGLTVLLFFPPHLGSVNCFSRAFRPSNYTCLRGDPEPPWKRFFKDIDGPQPDSCNEQDTHAWLLYKENYYFAVFKKRTQLISQNLVMHITWFYFSIFYYETVKNWSPKICGFLLNYDGSHGQKSIKWRSLWLIIK